MEENEFSEELLKNIDLEGLVAEVLRKRKEDLQKFPPPEAWFLGPKAEHGDVWLTTIEHIFRDYVHWRRNYFPEDPIVVDREQLKTHEPWVETLKFEIDSILNQLKAHFPFHSPRYIAHMISEQTFPGVVGYFAGMLYNPNNVTEESAPITTSLEIEAGKMIAEMLGYNPNTAWAHICSGGTLANLEALWIARMVQFAPLIVKDFCETHAVRDFEISMPDGSKSPVVDVPPKVLLGLRPNEAAGSVRALASHLAEAKGDAVYEDINSYFATNRFNVSYAGLHSILAELGVRPVVFVSEAAHYSIKKAVNILGYGEACIRSVPVEPHFRMNVDALREEVFRMAEDEYIAAVIAVAGTTEEGAVDPIHRIRFLRDDLEKDTNRSFWLHVDAAWGGYVRSVFCGLGLERESDGRKRLQEICEEYRKAIEVREETEVPVLDFDGEHVSEGMKKLHLEWADFEVYSAYLAMPDADSITVDPHKLGYLPYPAGVIAFQNKLVTELVVQKAQYITDEIGGLKSAGQEEEITAVGPYIIEGSKPGAVAAACWLSHKTIPLNYNGHGRLIKTSLLNTKKLARYFDLHERLFDTIEHELYGEIDPAIRRFTFELLCEPDTNLLCYLCLPMKAGKDGKLERDNSAKLADINELNEAIYKRATIRNRPGKRKTPYSQEYFVSRTILTAGQYHPGSISGFLERLDIPIYDYEREGIFLLRSVVMNPWHFLAEKRGKNYLYDFVVHLHQTARDILNP
ncbi:MAG: hypothetical protein IPM63_09915 [Acidobacteriota bacterium]|nr:MAG: hypothetical protein IPM63_09915 [Acidobacteriota bacterium]